MPEPWYHAFWSPAFGPVVMLLTISQSSEVEWKLMLQTLHWNSVSPSGIEASVLVLGDEAEVVLAADVGVGGVVEVAWWCDVAAARDEAGVRVVDDDHRVEPVDRVGRTDATVVVTARTS